MRAFNDRRLDDDYPFVLVDAMFIKSRAEDRVVSRAVLVVSGIRDDGYREILGVRMGDTESFSIWEETFRWHKGRGLKGVMFVISDQAQRVGGSSSQALSRGELAALPGAFDAQHSGSHVATPA